MINWLVCSATMLQIAGQQAASRQAQQEKAALSKLEKLQLDQGRRAEDLEKNAAEAEEKVGVTCWYDGRTCDRQWAFGDARCSEPLSQPAANAQGNVRKQVRPPGLQAARVQSDRFCMVMVGVFRPGLKEDMRRRLSFADHRLRMVSA